MNIFKTITDGLGVQNQVTHIISYDLPGKTLESYKKIEDKIKTLGMSAKPLNTFWTINTQSSCEEIITALSSFVLPTGKLYVANIATGVVGKLGIQESDLELK